MDYGEVPGTVAASHSDGAKDVADPSPQTDNTLHAIGQLRLEMTKDLEKAIRELRQKMFSATLPISSNGSDGDTSPSRNPGSWATPVKCLPEIASVASDTGILGTLGELLSNVVFNKMATMSLENTTRNKV